MLYSLGMSSRNHNKINSYSVDREHAISDIVADQFEPQPLLDIYSLSPFSLRAVIQKVLPEKRRFSKDSRSITWTNPSSTSYLARFYEPAQLFEKISIKEEPPKEGGTVILHGLSALRFGYTTVTYSIPRAPDFGPELPDIHVRARMPQDNPRWSMEKSDLVSYGRAANGMGYIALALMQQVDPELTLIYNTKHFISGTN